MTSQQHPLPNANVNPPLLVPQNSSAQQARPHIHPNPLDSTHSSSVTAHSLHHRGLMGGVGSSSVGTSSGVTVNRNASSSNPNSASSRRPSSGRFEPWPEEAVDNAYGLYSLHRMFDIVGAQLTHRDVRVLSFLFVDVIDEYERGGIRSGRDFLLALERQGRCDETNFRHVLQLLRIITRHDLLPYVTLRKRQTVCPDPVDKYLEETSVRYVSPRGGAESRESIPHRRAGPQPVICCSPSGPQVGPSRTKPAPPGPSRKRKRTHTTGDCREKQTCDIRLRVRAEYCQHESALQGNVFSNKQEAVERQFERFNQANTILKSRDLGSIICDIKFSELTYLDAFWRDYINGSLLEALKGVFITDSLKQAVGHEAIKLLVNVDEEDYQAGRRKLLRNLVTGGSGAGESKETVP
ncbi:death effector domain-containing protein [Hypomesus transpacificus]|uniref:death effector domain-containing protein n=1 Tax=Hypomesus transpacificus TaxID=137520 RepID=UPI001F078BAE|nr:death effector domain-containing protein [Hypomesus transpacificus]XP_046897078.1 death effector domain-containing protein [Hypomesus transpacificus]XP_046897079.1 death effector domain-containing protein [Hypomesus transpacificus]XP_046897080.1 death effector domain-containing protein [Hypomesus transpacificus]XP_046897081.1 death effector domain-containing protein [Hypomesus transpacificus]XP_046897083.1 death effector domain-containing protein [Hypomesus transpacificus]XP_046897084.1 de